jgi:phosphoribosyl 1,2-cyclic phosphodiesterase
MSLIVTSLNSGSNGNCYYVGTERDAILIDAGISCRETEKRMKRLGLSMKSVRAIFVSHEHSDHIKGIPVLAGRYECPVYITTATLEGCGFSLDDRLIRSFDAMQEVELGELKVTAFTKLHDAVEPHSFVVAGRGVRVGIFTDIGRPCEQVIRHFSQCHAAFLETNYDERMLEQGRYPIYLKNRIRGGHGHLSNTQALELFRAHKPAYMTHLFLSHLSRDNNNPRLAEDLFKPHAGRTRIVVASRDEETAVYTISAGEERVVNRQVYLQVSLF